MEFYLRHKTLFNIGGGASLLFLISYGIFQTLIINILSFIYLTVKTISVIENQKTLKRDLIRYLKLWIYYAVEVMISFVVSYMPISSIYNIIRLLIFLWIIYYGSELNIIYNYMILPTYKQYHAQLRAFCHLLEKIVRLYRSRVKYLLTNHLVYVRDLLYTYLRELVKDKVITYKHIDKLLEDPEIYNDIRT